MMEKRQLGFTDLHLSVLGMGCWSFGGGEYWGESDQSTVNRIVSKALDAGMNYFDTAEVYNDGASEVSLGIALAKRRHKAVIGTKVSPANTRPKDLRKHCEASLRRLNTDYIDLYMLHWPINSRSVAHFTKDQSLIAAPPLVADAFETLEALQRQGKIRHIGVSNFGVRQMEETRSLGTVPVANELPYNLLSRAIEEEIMPYCEEHGIGIIGYMALQQGVLAGIYPTPDAIPAPQAHSRHFGHARGGAYSRHEEEGAEEEVFEALNQIKDLAIDLGVEMAQLALAWSITNRRVACTLVGSRTVEELEMNTKAVSHVLSSETVKILNDITEPVLDALGSSPDYYENRSRSRIF